MGECDGDYRHDSRKNVLEWRLPVIDASNKSGSMEFTVAGHTNDFFPVSVNFVSKKSFCDIEVRMSTSLVANNRIVLQLVLYRGTTLAMVEVRTFFPNTAAAKIG